MISAVRATSRWPLSVQLACAVLGTLACFIIQLPIEARSFGDPLAGVNCDPGVQDDEGRFQKRHKVATSEPHDPIRPMAFDAPRSARFARSLVPR